MATTKQAMAGYIRITDEHQRALIAAMLKADGPVARSELRALLPHGVRRYAGLTKTAKEHLQGGSTRAGNNDVTLKLNKKLRVWEDRGWIARTETHVIVVDRAALEARLAELECCRPRRTVAEIEREIAARGSR